MLYLKTMIAVLVSCTLIKAQEGALWVKVTDCECKPIPRVTLAASSSESPPTDDEEGKTRIDLPADARPGQQVRLHTVSRPPAYNKSNLIPRGGNVVVPEWGQVFEIYLIKKGDIWNVNCPNALVRTVRSVLIEGAAVVVNTEIRSTASQDVQLKHVEEFGPGQEETERAVRSLLQKATDPLIKAQCALYIQSYPEATKLFSEAIEKLEKHARRSIDAQRNLFDALSFLGQSLYRQGKFRESAKAYQKAVAFNREDAVTLNALAVSLHSAGEYAEAGKVLSAALGIAKKDGDRETVGAILNNIGGTYDSLNNTAKAIDFYRQALAIHHASRNLWGEKVTLQSIGTIRYLTGHSSSEYRLALADFDEAIKIGDLLGDDLALGDSRMRPCYVYNTLGKSAASKLCTESALNTSQAALESGLKRGDKTAQWISLRQLGQAYASLGETDKAIDYYKQALDTQKAVLGADHPDVATTLNEWALIYFGADDYKKAEALYERALEIREKALGPNHPDVANLLNNYAALLRKMNQTDKAIELEKRGLDIQIQLKRLNSTFAIP